MTISNKLLKILACPICKSNLSYNKTKLTCDKCKKEYIIKKNIPILIP